MIAEYNYDKYFPFKSTFDLQIQDGGLWSLPKYRQVEELVILCTYLDENLYRWVLGVGKCSGDLKFSFRSKFDLQIQNGGLSS